MGVTGSGDMDIKVAQGALLFDGTDFVDFSGARNQKILNSPNDGVISIAAWIWPDNPSNYDYIISRADFDGGEYSWICGLNNEINPMLVGGAANDIVSSSSIPDNHWTHLIFTIDGTTGTIYENGRLRTTGTIDGIDEHVVPMCMGARWDAYPDYNNNFGGKIHGVMIWSGIALSAEDAKRVYDGLDVQTGNLVANFRFNERKGDTLKDSVNGIKGTISGASFDNREIRCRCSRWSEQDNNIVVETLLDPCDRNYLFSHVLPGEIREHSNSLGWEINRDGTFKSGNTLVITPVAGTKLANKRDERTIVVRSITDWFVNPHIFGVKIEGKRVKKFADYT